MSQDSSSGEKKLSPDVVHRQQIPTHKLHEMLAELQAEFDSYRDQSSELEQELEMELERVERRARLAEQSLADARANHKEATLRLSQEIVRCQTEMAKMREEQSAAKSSSRDMEEALEQAEESERRARAEVESLREALDASFEMATLSQTELEELKRSSDATTRHLYEDLEEAQSELALLTPMKALLTPMRTDERASGADDMGGGSYCSEGQMTRSKRHFFTMASMEEDSARDGSVGADRGAEDEDDVEVRQNESPRAVLAKAQGATTEDLRQLGLLHHPLLSFSSGGDQFASTNEQDSRDDRVTTLGSPAFQYEAAKLQAELERQLRLSSRTRKASPSSDSSRSARLVDVRRKNSVIYGRHESGIVGVKLDRKSGEVVMVDGELIGNNRLGDGIWAAGNDAEIGRNGTAVGEMGCGSERIIAIMRALRDWRPFAWCGPVR